MNMTVMGLRLREDEKKLIEDAAKLQAEPGERGGASSWMRRVILREARRVMEAAQPAGSK
jgi:uncharacterized protein (DUF1778 family)